MVRITAFCLLGAITASILSGSSSFAMPTSFAKSVDFSTSISHFVQWTIDNRSDIVLLQRTLNALGFDAGGADGVVGGRTRSALREFQNAYGVPVTGRLDAPTRRALDRAVSGAMERHQPIGGGSVSREVQAYHNDISQERFAELESLLIDMGYDSGEADGVVTDQTRRAIATFQRDRGMEVTGLIDSNTEAGIIEVHADQAYYGVDLDGPLPEPEEVAGKRTWAAWLAEQDGVAVPIQDQKHHLALAAQELRDIQMMLNTLGYEGGMPGSLFTTGVHDAIAQFQKANSLSVTGVVNEDTLAALARACLEIVAEHKGVGSPGLPAEQMARYRAYAARGG